MSDEDDERELMEEYMKEEADRAQQEAKVLAEVKGMVSEGYWMDIEEEIRESDRTAGFIITDKPCTDDVEQSDLFKIYISQHAVGESGDSWEGDISIELPNGKYLTFGYEM